MKKFMWAIFSLIVITLFIIGDSIGVSSEGEVVPCEGHLAESVAKIITTIVICGTLIYLAKLGSKLYKDENKQEDHAKRI